MKAGDPSGAEQALRSALPILNANGPEYMAAADLVNHQLVSALRAQNKTQEADNLKASLPPSPPDQPTDTKPQIMSKGETQYSEAARRKGLSGLITLRALIEETGNPKEIQVIQPLGFGLDENAVKAVQTVEIQAPHSKRRSNYLPRHRRGQLSLSLKFLNALADKKSMNIGSLGNTSDSYVQTALSKALQSLESANASTNTSTTASTSSVSQG